MRRTYQRHRPLRWLPMIVAAALVFAACSAGDSGESFQDIASGLGGGLDAATDTSTAGDSGEASERTSEQGGSQEGSEEPASEEDLGDGGIDPVSLQVQDLGRDIIFTAQLTVAVNDVAAAGDQATREIQNLGGFLFGQRTTGAPEPTSILTFKIQPEDFQTALDRLGSIGELRTQNVTADDVTERIVDLESRIETAAASVDRLRTLLGQATDIKAIVELESELLARETELETLRGSLRTLRNQVSLATIVLTLTEAASRPELDVALTAYPSHDSGLSCPGDVELVVDQDTGATICLEITNVGDTWLADFEVRDPVLDIELDDLIVVFGDPTQPIEPGESILLAAEITPTRDLRTRTTVTATPVDEDGNQIPDRPASTKASIFVGAADPGGIPTFQDGLEASWNLLVDLGQLLVLIAGALIPFFWVPVLAWFAWTFWRRRSDQVVTPAKSEVE